MDAENLQRISVIDPISPAFEHVRLMLFRPFDLSKWFIIGFCGWLAYLGQGGGGGNGWGRHGDGPANLEAIKSAIIEHLAVIIFVGAIVVPLIIILMLVLCWLRSRGQFMFVHCIAGNKAEIGVPWKKFSSHGNSVFLFRIVLGIISFFAIAIPVAIAILAGTALCATGFNPAAIIGMIGTIFVAVVVCILFFLIAKFTIDFVVPIMFLNTASVIAGWKMCLGMMGSHKAQMLLYILFQIVISIVITSIIFAVCLIGCCCCCISILLFVPYIGTVILLPLVAFKRAYSLFYLRQFGPQFDVFGVQPAQAVMTERDNKRTIFISAAEPSADRHCAALIQAIKQIRSDLEFVGVGGPKMAEAGCVLIENTVGRAAMTYKAFAHISHFYRLIKQVEKFIAANKPNLVIVCDSPAFNFHVAKAAKKSRVKTLFYVAPQLWAWAPWRIRKLRKCCDKLCCLLPFEQEWFTSRGVPAEFVGNPLLDELTPVDLNGARRDYRNFNPGNVKIAIVPGSRAAEVGTLWRPMQEIAMSLRKKYTGASFTTVAVDAATRDAPDSTRLKEFQTDYSIDSVYQTTRRSDFALVASGSATLQAASAGCPMVIMYQTSPLLWHLVGRWLVTTKYLSLVNILAHKELVPEYMPYFISIEPIIESIQKLLEDKARLTQTNAELLSLVGPLTTKKAGSAVAQIASSMLA